MNHLRRKRAKQESEDDDGDFKAEEEDAEVEGVKKQEDGSQGSEDDAMVGVGGSANALLPDFEHKIQATLREPSRQLKVKDLIINFDPTSVFGHRLGYIKALMATAACPSATFLGLFEVRQ